MKAALLLTMSATTALCQQAQISGVIQDPSGLNVAGAAISVRSEETGGQRETRSNHAGFYTVASLKPGTYRIAVRAMGFQTTVQEGVKLEVGDNARLDFMMRIGDSHTVVTVSGAPPLVNTENASVGTLIGRDFIDRMPLNGRGIQSLIELTPGVEAVPVLQTNAGQFSVNGQRSDGNYFTVDGVSANFEAGIVTTTSGVSTHIGQTGGAALPANNLLGTFSNLVSPDALQEFKIQTSTFAPEFGRMPGAQIGFVTRSGTSRYSASLFEYIRNDIFDANDWFNNQHRLRKPPLRFNNFGVTLGGPVPRVFERLDRTFFFFSFENLVMRQPQPVVPFLVPDEQTRLSASPLVAPLYNALPLPNLPATGISFSKPGWGAYAQGFSIPADQQTYGLRLDRYFSDNLIGFLRYNYAPSNVTSNSSISPLTIAWFAVPTGMTTIGLTSSATPTLVNEFRANLSWQDATFGYRFVSEGGGRDPSNVLFPPGYTAQNSFAGVLDGDLPNIPPMYVGRRFEDRSRQVQVVDQLSWLKGTHQWKFGADYRFFSLVVVPPRAFTSFQFEDLPSGVAFSTAVVYTPTNVTYHVPAFSLYAQDTWHLSQRLTLTYGARWELAPAPRASSGDVLVYRQLTAANSSDLVPAPPRTPFYRTQYAEIAPRLGVAWQVGHGPLGKTVLRAGAGTFYDLGQTQFETALAPASILSAQFSLPFGTWPNNPIPGPGYPPPVAAAGYTLPRTYEWNVTMEQSFGQESFSAAYLGALGRRLTGTGFNVSPALDLLHRVFVATNAFSSSYNSLQLQFNRRVSKRIQALLSYTWSHSVDNLSSETIDGVGASYNLTFSEYPNLNRGSSDFDIRHSLHGAVFATLPSRRSGFAAQLLRNWTASTIFFARSALPSDVLIIGADIIRPDLVPGQPLYLYRGDYPGGKVYNSAAFTVPPSSAVEGNFGRNVLRGFGAWQADLAVHRQFKLSEHAALQFRVEAFNVFNHPNFANPSLDQLYPNEWIADALSPGLSRRMLASALSPTGTLGELNPVFQVGGPRLLQFALRLTF